MNIAILAAGAGDMICGSCLRDSSMARALIALGHKVTLIPLYTPLRTDADDVSLPQTFYGGINAWLQNKVDLFRHTPRALDWLLDRGNLLRWAGNFGAQTPPDNVADLTAAIIRGEGGTVRKELHRLIDFLRDEVKPDVVSIPNLMFIGTAKPIHEALGVPVVCELTGEDIFLDAMSQAHRAMIRDLVCARANDVFRFVSTTHYYADRMADYLSIDRLRIDVVQTGLPAEFFAPKAVHDVSRPRTVGFLARICPEKGLELLVDAMLQLRTRPGMQDVRLRVAGYLGRRDRSWFDRLRTRVDASEMRNHFDYAGEVTQAGKIAMLDSIDLFSVPTIWPEPKGISVLEAMARGVPVVQPDHGSFPEMIGQTSGGTLVRPNHPTALADALDSLLRDSTLLEDAGHRARCAMKPRTDEHMAREMIRIYEGLR